MGSLDGPYALGHWVIFNVCRIRAKPEMGRGRRSFSNYGGRKACDYDYEPWSNGHSFLPPSSAGALSLKGMARSIGSPNKKMVLVLQLPRSFPLWSWRTSSGIDVGLIGVGQGETQQTDRLSAKPFLLRR